MISSNERLRGVSGAHIDTIFLVWIYNNTNRRILAVLLFHGDGNLTGEIMGFSPEMYPFIVSGYAVAAFLIVAVGVRKRLRDGGKVANYSCRACLAASTLRLSSMNSS